LGFFPLIKWSLAVIVAVTIWWPLNVPLAALAYRVRHGHGELPLETDALWWRSAGASLGLALMSALMLGLNFFLVARAFLPSGPVQLVLFMAYLAAAPAFLFWIFALEDFLEALSLFLIYVLVPGLVLLIVDRLLHFWLPLQAAAAWLQTTT
jgi:hypothetical protein